MNSAQMWSFLIAAGSPAIIAIVLQATWSSNVKVVISIVAAIAIGVGSAYFTDQFTGIPITQCLIIALTAVVGSYKALWSNTGILALLEEKINIPVLKSL